MTAIRLVDSHIHLDFPAFNTDRPSLIASARAAGIERFIVPATTLASWTGIEMLERSNPVISVAYGIHPYFVDQHSLNDCDQLDNWLLKHRCVAVGEIGLDYFLPNINRSHQMALFDAQMDLARKHSLPVILHARKAFDDVINRIKIHNINKGIVHSFNGSYVQAERLVDLGFKLGFGGAITYQRARRLRTLIQDLPLTTICLETDAPDQPSAGFYGKRNDPLALLEVLDVISRLRGTDREIIARQTMENTYAALNIC